MGNENLNPPVLAGSSAIRIPRLDRASGPAETAGFTDNRSLTIVVINLPVASAPHLSPAARPGRLMWPRRMAVPSRTTVGKGRRLTIPAAVLLLTGAAASWWAVPHGGATEPADAIRIVLPPPRVVIPAPADVGAVPFAARAPENLTAARQRSGARASVSRGAPPGASLTEIGDVPEVAAATTLALRSGVAHTWQARGLTGVAVAGPVHLEGANVCRTVAVLADGGAGGQTVSSLRCMSRTGKWVHRTPARGREATSAVVTSVSAAPGADGPAEPDNAGTLR